MNYIRGLTGSGLHSHLILARKLLRITQSLSSFVVHDIGHWYLLLHSICWWITSFVWCIVVWLDFLELIVLVLQVVLDVLVPGIFNAVWMIMLLAEVLPMNLRVPRWRLWGDFSRIDISNSWSSNWYLGDLNRYLLRHLTPLIKFQNTFSSQRLPLGSLTLWLLAGWCWLVLLIN